MSSSCFQPATPGSASASNQLAEHPFKCGLVGVGALIKPVGNPITVGSVMPVDRQAQRQEARLAAGGHPALRKGAIAMIRVRGVVAQNCRQRSGPCLASRPHLSRAAQPISSWSQQAYRRPDANSKMRPELETVLPKVAQPHLHRSLLLCELTVPIVRPLDHLKERRQRGFPDPDNIDARHRSMPGKASSWIAPPL